MDTNQGWEWDKRSQIPKSVLQRNSWRPSSLGGMPFQTPSPRHWEGTGGERQRPPGDKLSSRLPSCFSQLTSCLQQPNCGSDTWESFWEKLTGSLFGETVRKGCQFQKTELKAMYKLRCFTVLGALKQLAISLSPLTPPKRSSAPGSKQHDFHKTARCWQGHLSSNDKL